VCASCRLQSNPSGFATAVAPFSDTAAFQVANLRQHGEHDFPGPAADLSESSNFDCHALGEQGANRRLDIESITAEPIHCIDMN
jgi:hypothetical protein